MPKQSIKCPECRKTFKTIQLLSMHRSKAHGVAGKSKEAVRIREANAARNRQAATQTLEAATPGTTPTPAPMPPPPPPPDTDVAAKGKFDCPECGNHYTSKTGLGIHRSAMHGVISKATLRKKERLGLTGDGRVECSFCDFVAKSPSGLGIHVGTIHKNGQGTSQPKELSLERTAQAATPRLAAASNGNGHHQAQPWQADSAAISEATLALGLGRFQGLCSAMAQEFDVPPRSFAAQLARLIYATQVR